MRERLEGASMEEQREHRHYKVIIEPDEDGVFVATAPSVPGVAEQGETREEAFERMNGALVFHLECMAEEGEEIPPSDASVQREVREMALAI